MAVCHYWRAVASGYLTLVSEVHHLCTKQYRLLGSLYRAIWRQKFFRGFRDVLRKDSDSQSSLNGGVYHAQPLPQVKLFRS